MKYSLILHLVLPHIWDSEIFVIYPIFTTGYVKILNLQSSSHLVREIFIFNLEIWVCEIFVLNFHIWVCEIFVLNFQIWVVKFLFFILFFLTYRFVKFSFFIQYPHSSCSFSHLGIKVWGIKKGIQLSLLERFSMMIILMMIVSNLQWKLIHIREKN